MLRATMACTLSTSRCPKVVRDRCVLPLLTCKCASRPNGVHFFDIATSKSAPKLRCFATFDLQMCFVPHRRALFRHRNFYQNVLRTTMPCTFATSQLRRPRMVCFVHFDLKSQQRCALFKISTSKSAPNMVCFVYFGFHMCFAPPPCAVFRDSNF